ncbi:MAG: M20 aminoacylase family protein [Burkholderiales bacterium]
MLTPVDEIRKFHAELREIRHDIHAHPELGFEEDRTAELVAGRLAAWGIDVHRGLARTGVVGVVRGRRSASGRAVGLRADMDCLPIRETTGLPYRSRHDGRMHACGHDGHTTMLLGAARYLAATRAFDGTAYLIFQPAEEGGGGGPKMVQEGLFERFPADEIYALHNWPGLPPGKIAVRAGAMMAATDEIQITVRGKGGHAAMPHLTVDPVLISAHIITALQSVPSRNIDPVDALVISICSMQTSQVGAFNVLPDSVALIGTVRSFRPATRDLAEARIKQIVTGIAGSLGASAELQYQRGYPATVNAAREAEFAAQVGEKIFGPENVVRDADPTMGGEDFSYMLQQKPGAYVWLGQGAGQTGCSLHNPGYDFNDEIIPLGAGYLAALVEQSLPLR